MASTSPARRVAASQRDRVVAFLPALIVAIALWASPLGVSGAKAAVVAAQPIGSVTDVRSTAYGTPPEAPRVAKQVADPLVFKEALETLSFSALLAGLNDGSVVTLGASARIVLDEFVYDPGSGATGLLINMSEGSLRFVTGAMKKESFQLQTPTATLAIRGTNFRVRVKPSGETLVSVDEGLVQVTLKSTGQVMEVGQGQSLEIKLNSQPEERGAGSKELFDLRTLFQPEGPLEREATEITIDGRIYYQRIEFNPDFAADVGNPIIDLGWSRAEVDGVGDKSLALIVPPPIQKTPGDHPDKPGISGGQYGGDGCECGF